MPEDTQPEAVAPATEVTQPGNVTITQEPVADPTPAAPVTTIEKFVAEDKPVEPAAPPSTGFPVAEKAVINSIKPAPEEPGDPVQDGIKHLEKAKEQHVDRRSHAQKSRLEDEMEAGRRKVAEHASRHALKNANETKSPATEGQRVAVATEANKDL